MCPSYMVTREEKHSTRGRARLLFEMMNGEVIDDGWKSEDGEGGAGPVPGVQGVQGRLPGQRGHGDVQGRVPRPLLRGPAAAAARVRVRAGSTSGRGWRASRRRWRTSSRRRRASAASPSGWPGWTTGGTIPAFAPRTFKEWFRSHRPQQPGGPPVVLWPDTFNNYFHPETAMAAVEVLEDAGLPRGGAAGRTSAAAGRCTTTVSWTWPGGGCVDLIDKLRAADRGRRADGRAGAELLGGLQGRADQHPARRTRTPSGCSEQVVHAGRIPASRRRPTTTRRG